ncbi:MAG: hypothetical protein ACRDTU_07880 [Micromonosporaceae bacterium]
MPQVPDVVTHYHLADKPPFLSLSELSGAELEAVLRDLRRRRTDSGLRRVFGSRYMDLRRLTESRLKDLFELAGGTPERATPHYFVLGVSRWFRGLSPDAQEITVPLAELPDDATSFTYPDSFTSMGYGPRFGVPYEPRPYHGKVFRLRELANVVAKYGIPQDAPEPDYEGYHRRDFETYIEIQLWSDAPLERFGVQRRSGREGAQGS